MPPSVADFRVSRLAGFLDELDPDVFTQGEIDLLGNEGNYPLGSLNFTDEVLERMLRGEDAHINRTFLLELMGRFLGLANNAETMTQYLSIREPHDEMIAEINTFFPEA